MYNDAQMTLRRNVVFAGLQNKPDQVALMYNDAKWLAEEALFC